ncbi:M15 family metallopeptidase [uncultured Umboniibacter sp.]|uniref:M15 family metallopeptidase n=1 Tax=uncultured Umboniibacter sp. TaxID=1798917 RepID=UPI00260BA8BF|nr:M15 family metallopeptidase [uncultured Umboniibacter sp.]
MSTANIDELTPNTKHAFMLLRQRAAREGIDLHIASGFRSVERQVQIWQRKNSPAYTFNINGAQKKAGELTDQEWLDCVMKWSAIPGLSRHHWGTDIDVFDAAAVPEGYQLQLTPEEYQPGGPFEKLGAWLAIHIDELRAEGFFRPYREFRGGVQPEAWHLSYKADADNALQTLLSRQPSQLVPLDDIRGGKLIASQLETIVHRYVINVDQ